MLPTYAGVILNDWNRDEDAPYVIALRKAYDKGLLVGVGADHAENPYHRKDFRGAWMIGFNRGKERLSEVSNRKG